jgi:4-amino-4-deoxy-L-arabinose transferase-like glycosyltransferase
LSDTFALVAVAVCVLLAGLGSYPLWDPDESRHAEIARQMVVHGHWVVPVLNGLPYYDKPAPFYWLVRAAYALVGVNELAARFPSAVATLLTLVIVHRFALRRFGRRAAALGALIYLTAPEVVALGRFCNLDATLTLCVTAAIVAWLDWIESPRGTPGRAYAAMAAGTLIKGPVAILLPLLVVLACAAGRGSLRRNLRELRPWLGIAWLSAITLPWFVVAATADPAYIATFLIKHNVLRYVSSSADHAHGVLYYVPVLAAGLLPWTLLLPVAIRVGRSASRFSDPASALRRARENDLLLWGFTVLVFFSLGRGKLGTYILPAVPAFAVWLGSRLSLLGERDDPELERWLRGAIVVWAAALICAPLGALIYLSVAYPELRDAVLVALPLPAIAVLLVRGTWREPARLAGVPLCFAAANLAIVMLGYGFAAPVASRAASDQAIAHAAERLAPGVPIIGFRVDAASLAFYTRRPVKREDFPRDVRAAAARGPVLIVTQPRHTADLRAARIQLYEWLAAPRHRLYATIPMTAAGDAKELVLDRLDRSEGTAKRGGPMQRGVSG